MIELLQQCLTLPTLIPTVLLGLVCVYWVLMIVSGLDLDVINLELDMDASLEGHESILDWGVVGLKWFNLGHVPLMVWISAFALPAWLMSVTFDREVTNPTWGEIATSTLRNFGVALFAAKLLTQPLKDKLKLEEPNAAEELLGRVCIISTSEATPDFGQAKYASEAGAPLLLTVNTAEGVIPRGHEARIIDYSPARRVYIVEPLDVANRE